MTRSARLSPICAALLGAATLLIATVLPAAEDIDLQVTVQGDQAIIGQNLILHLELTPPSGGRIMAENLQIDVKLDSDAEVLGLAYAPVNLTAPTGDPAAYPGVARLEWSAPVAADAVAATIPVTVTVSGRTDSGDFTAQQTLDVKVDYGEDWSADRITAFIDNKGYLPFMLVVFGFGVLMSLSPCIYPMIPITLAVIGVQSQEKGALHGLMLSITYAIGMALVYAIMGALSATVFSGITAFMQSPTVLVPIAVLLLVLSFGMFGAFELQAPQFMRDKLGGPGGNRSGLIGVFIMGLVAGLVASPCVGPFLAALLVWVATTGNVVLGFFCLFTFGIGMSLLLVAVGTFPGLMGSLPQSGGWMETIKKAMGLLLVAMAFYFVRPGMFIPEHIFYPLVGAVTVMVAVYMGAFDSMVPETGWWGRAMKGLGLIVFACGLFVMVGSFYIHGIFLPERWGMDQAVHAGPAAVAQIQPTAATGSATAAQPALPAKVQWQKVHTGENVKAFFAEQFVEAKAAGKPVMIDFWANWCKLCKVLDKSVWNQPEVVAESQRFVTIKVDATESDAEMEEIFAEYKVPGLPTIVFIDSRGEVLLGRNSAFKPADQMLELMKTVR